MNSSTTVCCRRAGKNGRPILLVRVNLDWGAEHDARVAFCDDLFVLTRDDAVVTFRRRQQPQLAYLALAAAR